MIVGSGAVLDLNGQTLANTNFLTLSGSGISNGGALINSSATPASYAGNVFLAAATTIGGANGMTLSGGVSGTNTLTKVARAC